MDFYLSTVYIFNGENCKYTLILQIEECEREVVIMSDVRTIVEKYTYKGKEYTYSIYSNVNVVKKQTFVNTVVKLVVADEGYQMLLKEKLFYFQLISVFTDIFLDSQAEIAERGFQLQDIVDFIDNTNVVVAIADNLDNGVFEELANSVNIGIEYKTGIHRNPLGEAVASLLSTLEEKVKDINLSELMGFARVFKDIPIENMTPEKLWDAYAKSDAFKKVRAEINEKSQKESNNVIKITEAIEDVQKPKKRGRKPKAKKETVEQNDTK